MSKFKVGDKVKVVRKVGSFKGDSWVSGMDDYVGTEQVVSMVNADGNIVIDGWSFPPESLEPVGLSDAELVGEGYRRLGPDEVIGEGVEHAFVSHLVPRGGGAGDGDSCFISSRLCFTGETVRDVLDRGCYGDIIFRVKADSPVVPEFRLQPGKYYRQRNGDKAYVAAELPEELVDGDGRDNPFLGVDSDGDTATWRGNGRFYDDLESDYDIVAEWTEEPEPTDAEVAEAIRWFHENNKRLQSNMDGTYSVTDWRPGDRPPSTKDFVKAHKAETF